MNLILAITGILAVILFLLASLNGLKPYIKTSWIKKITHHHRILGMLSSFIALIHMIVAIINDSLRITGALTLLLLIATGLAGMLFKTFKKKKFYLLHRLLGPITMVFMIIHIVFNHSF
jgi:hypothetical protein